MEIGKWLGGEFPTLKILLGAYTLLIFLWRRAKVTRG